MKRVIGGLLVAVSLAGIATDALARGHGGFRGGFRGPGVRFGAFIAAPLVVGVGAASYYGYAYGSPYYYGGYPYYGYGGYGYGNVYPPVTVTGPASAPTYVEQAPAASAPAQAAASSANAYWYYCAQSQGYYPYVRECPGGWQPVAPQPSR